MTEDTIVCRLLADLSVVTAGLTVDRGAFGNIGVGLLHLEDTHLTYQTLLGLYQAQPGLAADKLKVILEFVWRSLSQLDVRGVVFAYDEAQTMDDHKDTHQFPLSLLLDVFQSVQRKGMRFMLVMAGLPTLFPKLIAARTYAERMFRVLSLGKLNAFDSRAAIEKAIRKERDCPIEFSPKATASIIEASDGYPYFIQFMCRETFDVYAQQWAVGAKLSVSLSSIIKKLDKEFFVGRWIRATERQRELLTVIARLRNCDSEFSVQEIVAEAQKSERPFSASHTIQMLTSLSNSGLAYKNGHGRYSFAVPLLGQFIRRQEAEVDGSQLKLPIDNLIT